MKLPAPPNREYVGSRRALGDGTANVHIVEPSGKRRRLNPRHDLRNHSPDGFEWGYGGSGPAQLALALVADATGDDDLAQRVYQDFKFRFVARWGDDWKMLAAEIVEIARALDREKAE